MNCKELIKENVDCEVWKAKLLNCCWGFDRESEAYKSTEKFLGEHKFEVILSERSNDGDHDGWDIYFKFDDRFFSVCGWYSSEGGVELDDPFDFCEVRPVQKTITVYEAI